METTNSMLDALKVKLNLRSDYALAKYLGVTTVSMSRWRSGGSLSDDNAIRVARMLGMNPAYALACIHAERQPEDGETSGIWRQIADAVRTSAAGVALAAVLVFSGFAPSSTHAAGRSELPNNVYYGKSPRVLRRGRRRGRNGGIFLVSQAGLRASVRHRTHHTAAGRHKMRCFRARIVRRVA